MPEGTMWFDNDKKKDVVDKIREGIAYVKEKYLEDIKFVHVSIAEFKDQFKDQDDFKVDGIPVIIKDNMLPSHYWVCWKE